MIIKLLMMLALILFLTAPVLLKIRYDVYGQARAKRKAIIEANKRKQMNEALNVLQLPLNASKGQIKEAHKKLMQKNHPDLGGSKYVATKINVARDVLLKEAA